MKLEESYHKFAMFYDEYMQHVNYENWVNFILNQYNHRHNESAADILELACGTGNIATRLVQRGYSVTATDLSSAMIDIARKKPFPAKFLVKDMRDAIEPSQYNLILLLFDSLNYMTVTSEIAPFLENVYSGLKDEGLFIFDISTEKNCMDNFDGFLNIEDKENHFIIHHSEYHPENRMQNTHFTLFERSGEFYQRFDEIHRQKIYKVQTVIEKIEKSSLQLFGMYSINGDHEHLINKEEHENADQCFPRIFFVCGK